MNCPECDSKTKVTDTQHNHQQQETYRKRLCPSCGYEFFTLEIEVENDDFFQAKYKKNSRQYKRQMEGYKK